ncbi:hypothetical protein [Luteimonas sp. A478]
MKPKQIPLVLALGLALGTLAAGCAQEAPVPADQDTAASAQVTAAGSEVHPVGDHDSHAAHDDHDVSHAAGVDFPVPDNHTPWQPDAPLIEGMSQVRAAVDSLAGAPDAATVQSQAGQVDSAIDYMFENCSLPTEPDVALHAILARLMAGSQALQADPSDTAPVQDMQGAVSNYEALFDDPNAG